MLSNFAPNLKIQFLKIYSSFLSNSKEDLKSARMRVKFEFREIMQDVASCVPHLFLSIFL